MSDPHAVVVRGMEPSDYEALWEIWTCPEVVRQTLSLPFMSRAEAQQKLANPPAGFRALVAEVDGRVVGQAGLHTYQGRRAHVGQVGIMVHDDYAGRGVGSALMAALIKLAEDWLGLTRLELKVYTDNAAAIHLYEKFGFVVEGTKRRYALRDGAYGDVYVMARLRE